MSGRIRHFAPPLRPIPRGDHYTEFETDDGRRVFIHRDVLTELAALERDEHPNESAGLLFGRSFTDGANQCALVRHLIRPAAGEVIGTPVTVTITAEGSNRMSQRAQERFPCADAVGWAHTHPTFGAYFSGTDKAEQAIWTSPAAVGLVASGLPNADPPFEVFVGPNSTPTRLASPLVWKTPPPPEDAWPRSRCTAESQRAEAWVDPAPTPAAWRSGAEGARPRRRPRRRHFLPLGPAARRIASTAVAMVLAALLVWLLSQWVVGSQDDAGSPGAASAGLIAAAPGEAVAGLKVLRGISLLVASFGHGVSEVLAAPDWGGAGAQGDDQ